MVEAHPGQTTVDARTLAGCIEACFDCAQACSACADACLGGEEVASLARCIRLDLDCADICDATDKVLSRQTAFEADMVRGMVEACTRACGLCAEACRCCENSCNEVLQAL